MNMFRDLFTILFFGLGIGILMTDPADWHWVEPAGPHAVDFVRFLSEAKPFSYVVCLVLGLALFMTRKQY